MVQLSFNAQAHQPSYGSEGGGLPVGKHKVVIDKTEVLPTSKGDGNMFLAISLKSIEGASAGTIQVDRLNLYNTNPQTVDIANKQLAAYCVVVGKVGFNDTTELHNIPFMVEIGQQRNNPSYTEVKKIFDISGNEPGKGPAPAATGGPPAGFGGTAAPAFAPAQPPQQQPPQQAWGAPPVASEPAPWAAPGAPAAPAARAQGAPAAPGWGNQLAAGGSPAWGPR